MKEYVRLLVLVGLVLGLLAACAQPTPEVIEVTTVVREEVEVTTEVEVPAEPTDRTVVEFWSTDNEEARVDLYEEVAARYMEENPEIEVRIVPIEEAGVTQRMATALAANRPPDIIRMGVERVAAFAADEILDEAAAQAVIDALGEDDFRAGPLQMVINPATGNYAAIPFDGWIQAIWYREDVFAEAGLDAPIAWEDINAACDTLPGTGNLLYAVTLGTDPGQNYGHQIFEQVAISNDAWPFDENGNVTMDTPEMIAALEFYAGLQRCSTAPTSWTTWWRAPTWRPVVGSRLPSRIFRARPVLHP